MREITNGEVKRLITKMKALYGRKFTQQWESVLPADLEEMFMLGMSGLTTQEIACGFNALMRHDWPPTVPEFRRMCQPLDPLDQQWESADKAWATAIQNTDERTTFATNDQIQQAWGDASRVWPDKFAARRAFCDAYDRLVMVQKSLGRFPVWFMSLGTEAPEHRANAIQQAVEMGKVSIGFKSDAVALLEQVAPIAPNAMEFLEKIKSQLGMSGDRAAELEAKAEAERQSRINGQVQALARAQAERDNYPDPFENWDEYQEACKRDGRAIPQAIYNCHNNPVVQGAEA